MELCRPCLHSAAVRDIVAPSELGFTRVRHFRCRRGINPTLTGCAGREKSMSHRYFACLFALVAAFQVASAIDAGAHPHVWVTVKSELVYGPDGAVTGVRHAWTFDDMFSTFAIQGIEGKNKGQFTREENDFFTYAKANGKPLEFNDPAADYYLEWDPKETVLTLFFLLPLKTPVKAKDLSLEIYDREFFVDFSFAEKNPVKLIGAPAQCKLSVMKPEEMNSDLAARLSQLAADQRDPTLTIGSEFANKAVVKCP
jgi:ABC-type uncharacterized transport system substrate-binding protein